MVITFLFHNAAVGFVNFAGKEKRFGVDGASGLRDFEEFESGYDSHNYIAIGAFVEVAGEDTDTVRFFLRCIKCVVSS